MKSDQISRALFDAAVKVRSNAYAPYSGFLVGAALIDDAGNIFVGCNVENSSYGGTICAERNAVAAMVAAGGRHFGEIVVLTDTDSGSSPCGICRQVLVEFAKDAKTAKIHIATTKGIVKTYSMETLLPEAFGIHDLRTAKRTTNPL